MIKKLNIDEARVNVKAGAAMLDRQVIAWQDKADVPTLRMGNSCDCILGHIYSGLAEQLSVKGNTCSGYVAGLSVLGLDYIAAYGYGFTLRHGCNNAADWDALTNLWVIEIEDRRLAKQLDVFV